METNNEKLERVLTAKNGIKEELVQKGYSPEEVGDNIEDYPNLVKNLSVIEEAPVDGKAYLRKDGGWVDLAADGGPMRGLFEAAGAVWHPESKAQDGTQGAYWLNGLEDITIKQMENIYQNANVKMGGYGDIILYGNADVRTTIPFESKYTYFYNVDLTRAFLDNYRIEKIVINNADSKQNKGARITLSSASSAFARCYRLKEIKDVLFSRSKGDIYGGAFDGCNELEILWIFGLVQNLDLRYSVNIGKESIKYIIDNSEAQSPISITLHHDAYARLVNDPDIVASINAKGKKVSLADAGAA